MAAPLARDGLSPTRMGNINAMNIAAEIRDRNLMTAKMISDAMELFERRAEVARTLEWAVTTCSHAMSEFQRQNIEEAGHFDHFVEICMEEITRDFDEIERMLRHAVKAAKSEEKYPVWRQTFAPEA